VETAVAGLVVFGFAGPAHAEAGHGGGGAVVRNVLNDGVARTAISAVGKRVEIAAVGWIVEVAQAVVAGGNVGRDQGEISHRPSALSNLETGFAGRLQVRHVDFGNPRQRRTFRAQPLEENRDLAALAFDLGFNLNPGLGVSHKAADAEPARQVPYEGPEANPLHGAANSDLFAHLPLPAKCNRILDWR
jgi:hypothetical protein